MIRATHGTGEVLDGEPLPAIYDSTGRGRYLRHGAATPQIVTAAQRAAARAKRKAQRQARKRSR
jgi:hypothetical protein